MVNSILASKKIVSIFQCYYHLNTLNNILISRVGLLIDFGLKLKMISAAKQQDRHDVFVPARRLVDRTIQDNLTEYVYSLAGNDIETI